MPKRKIKTEQISIRLSPEGLEAIDKICEDTRMTRADLIELVFMGIEDGTIAEIVRSLKVPRR